MKREWHKLSRGHQPCICGCTRSQHSNCGEPSIGEGFNYCLRFHYKVHPCRGFTLDNFKYVELTNEYNSFE